jgi:transcriptional regulator with XRE-family HTH domain
MLAENIRNLRIKRGLSQEKLARLADISNNTLVKIEMGMAKEPTITTVTKIADALGASLDELVGRKKMKKYQISKEKIYHNKSEFPNLYQLRFSKSNIKGKK